MHIISSRTDELDPTGNDDIQAWALLSLDGDRDAFEKLYRAMAEPLTRYLMPLTHSASETLDIVHDVFVRFWERRDRIRMSGSARALLYTMCRNHALNHLKRDRRSDALGDDANEIPYAVAFDAQHDSADLDRLLQSWIRDLPPRRSEAFMLSRYHDLSHAQIGVIMNLSERTVNTHIHHALRDLRERLNSYEAAL